MATIKQFLDSSSVSDKEIVNLVVGAAIEDVELGPEEVARYNSLSKAHKSVIDFIVGNLIQPDSVLKHSDISEVYLAHYGIKGMKWGVRRSNDELATARLSKSTLNTREGRTSARAAVKSGAATKTQESLAKLKSTGHRAVNAFTGDKTFWKSVAKTAGLGLVGLAVSDYTAGAISSDLAEKMGMAALGHNRDSVYAGIAESLGRSEWRNTANIGVATAAGTAAAVSVGSNVKRAVTGNRTADREYSKAVGDELIKRQKNGRTRVGKVTGG